MMADPLVTCLSYSAGVQSHGIVEMILAGLFPIPKRFAAIQADPGMESVVSYRLSVVGCLHIFIGTSVHYYIGTLAFILPLPAPRRHLPLHICRSSCG